MDKIRIESYNTLYNTFPKEEVEEYILEAEHQEGKEYWETYFLGKEGKLLKKELMEDFNLYIGKDKVEVSNRQLEILLCALDELRDLITRIEYTSSYKISYIREVQALEKSLGKVLEDRGGWSIGK